MEKFKKNLKQANEFYQWNLIHYFFNIWQSKFKFKNVLNIKKENLKKKISNVITTTSYQISTFSNFKKIFFYGILNFWNC